MASPLSAGGGKRLQALASMGWASLPEEILGSVLERLTVQDSFRFAAVCTSWASAAPPKNNGHYLPLAPQFPYLLLRHYRHGFILHSLLEKKRIFRCIPPFPDILDEHTLPSYPGTRFFGAQHGWFILHDGIGNWGLLNPITKARIQLPVLLFKVYRFFITPMPTADRYAAVALLADSKRLFFTRAGDDGWTPLEAQAEEPVESAVYQNNRFVAVTGDGGVHAIDPMAPRVEMSLVAEGSWYEFNSHLVESLDDLLLVTTDGDYDTVTTEVVEVRRLDPGTGTWVPVESLGDRSLFLGDMSSMSLSAQDVPGLKPNHIYFRERSFDGKQSGWYVKVYNFEDGSMNLCRPSKWLAGNLGRLPTIWFMPALR